MKSKQDVFPRHPFLGWCGFFLCFFCPPLFAETHIIPDFIRSLSKANILNTHNNLDMYELDRTLSRGEALSVSLLILQKNIPDTCDPKQYKDVSQ